MLPGVGVFSVVDGGLDVVTAERSELRIGDRLVQLNGRRLSRCDDLGSALHDAQQQQMLAVVALQRGGAVQTVLLSLPRATVAPAPAPPVAAAPVPPVAAPDTVPTPIVAAVLTPTRSLLRSNPAALAPMVAALREFGDQIKLPLPAPELYATRLGELRKTYRTLRARDEAIAAVDPIMSYYEAVGTFINNRDRVGYERVARDKVVAPGELARVRMPGKVLEYTTRSEVGQLLSRYDFLAPSIVRQPRTVKQVDFVGEVEWEGLWMPDEAIRLLVDRAQRDTAALAGA